jgi:hypothetical protein
MSIFTTAKEKDVFDSLNRELIETVIGQFVYYYQIDISNVKESIYNETISKTFFKPVKVFCLVDFIRPVSSAQPVGIDITYQIEVHFLRNILEDLQCNITEGSFFKFGEIYYEIDRVIQPKLIEGQPTTKWDVIALATSTRYTTLNISPTEEYHSY